MPRWADASPRRRWVEVSTRVRWSECDLQGHAYYGAYTAWCDLGREAFALAIGVDYLKYQLMTTEFHARYHRPAQYLDELVIRASALTPTARLDVNYEIYRKQGHQLLAEARSVHALVDQGGLRVTAPAEFHERFEAFLAAADTNGGPA